MISKCLVCTMMMVMAFSGCQKKEPPSLEAKKPLIQYVQSPQLAEFILKPKGRHFLVSRDPFKPIFTKEEMAYADMVDSGGQKPEEPTDDITLVGVVRFDNEYRAFIKFHGKSGVFKVQDKVGDYIIKDINLDQIVLTYGDHTIVKKRGEI